MQAGTLSIELECVCVSKRDIQIGRANLLKRFSVISARLSIGRKFTKIRLTCIRQSSNSALQFAPVQMKLNSQPVAMTDELSHSCIEQTPSTEDGFSPRNPGCCSLQLMSFVLLPRTNSIQKKSCSAHTHTHTHARARPP